MLARGLGIGRMNRRGSAGSGPAPTYAVNWTALDPAHKPGVRAIAALGWDGTGLLLFGGYNGANLADTWRWNGADWTQLTPAHAPSGRRGHAVAWDAARGQLVLFGGYVAGYDAETWVWDGSDWTKLTPAHAPSGRQNAAMAFDAARGVVVLFGGQVAGGAGSAETWTWDGTDWTQEAPAHAPSGRFGHGMAYDAARGEVVLLGGCGGLAPDAETWTWDGTDWTQEAPTHSPWGRWLHGMAYDAARERVVMLGGSLDNPAFPPTGDTFDFWEWDGTDWAILTPDTTPLARSYALLAYDVTRQNLVTFGGHTTDYAQDTFTAALQKVATLAPVVTYQRQLALIGGQSKGHGTYAAPALSTVASATDYEFNGGVQPGAAGTNLASFVGLKSDRTDPLSGGIAEDPGCGFAALLQALVPGRASVVSNASKDSTVYAGLKRGTVPYSEWLAQVAAFATVATAGGFTCGPDGVLWLHGEGDEFLGNLVYDTNLAELQWHIQADVRRLLARHDTVRLFLYQVSCWGLWHATPTAALKQAAAVTASGGRIVGVCPEYPIAHVADGLHFTAAGERHLAQYLAKAVYYRNALNTRWTWLEPLSIARSGATLDVTWRLPPGDTTLALDAVTVTDPNGQYGFEFSDNGAPVAITSTTVTGTNTTRHVLAAVPSGVNMRFRGGYTSPAVPENCGPTSGARTCLKAVSPIVSPYGDSLDDWCRHFDVACP